MAKTKRKNLSLKIPDLKSLIFGKQYQTESLDAHITGTRGFIPVKDIRDGIIITTDNRYIKVLEVLPVNFYLKSPMEQQNIIHYFINYLKIGFPMMMLSLLLAGIYLVLRFCL